MIEVYVVDGDIEAAVRQFRKQVDREGTIHRLKERCAFGHKRSTRLKRKLLRAARRRIKSKERYGRGNGRNRGFADASRVVR